LKRSITEKLDGQRGWETSCANSKPNCLGEKKNEKKVAKKSQGHEKVEPGSARIKKAPVGKGREALID